MLKVETCWKLHPYHPGYIKPIKYPVYSNVESKLIWYIFTSLLREKKTQGNYFLLIQIISTWPKHQKKISHLITFGKLGSGISQNSKECKSKTFIPLIVIVSQLLDGNGRNGGEEGAVELAMTSWGFWRHYLMKDRKVLSILVGWSSCPGRECMFSLRLVFSFHFQRWRRWHILRQQT